LVSIALWGIIMAIHETIMRAAIADMIPKERRGVSYGVFNVIYGAAWFAGSATIGLLYGFSIPAMILFVLSTEAAAFLIYIYLHKRAASSKSHS
ncbi:MAG: MFS transporter, partial [Anaerolineales bacterium]